MGSPFNFLRTIKPAPFPENDVRFRLSRLSDPRPGLNTLFIVQAGVLREIFLIPPLGHLQPLVNPLNRQTGVLSGAQPSVSGLGGYHLLP